MKGHRQHALQKSRLKPPAPLLNETHALSALFKNHVIDNDVSKDFQQLERKIRHYFSKMASFSREGPLSHDQSVKWLVDFFANISVEKHKSLNELFSQPVFEHHFPNDPRLVDWDRYQQQMDMVATSFFKSACNDAFKAAVMHAIKKPDSGVHGLVQTLMKHARYRNSYRKKRSDLVPVSENDAEVYGVIQNKLNTFKDLRQRYHQDRSTMGKWSLFKSSKRRHQVQALQEQITQVCQSHDHTSLDALMDVLLKTMLDLAAEHVQRRFKHESSLLKTCHHLLAEIHSDLVQIRSPDELRNVFYQHLAATKQRYFPNGSIPAPFYSLIQRIYDDAVTHSPDVKLNPQSKV